jgi:gas vesicle protein
MSRITVALKYSAVALAAAGAGVLAGLLVAPASGRETRRRWARRLEDETEQLKRTTRRLRARLTDHAPAERQDAAEASAQH